MTQYRVFFFKCSFRYYVRRLKGICCSHFLRLEQKNLKMKRTGSKSYILDEVKLIRREEVRHEVNDSYSHSLDIEMLLFGTFCQLHKRAPHLPVSSPNMWNWQKKRNNKSLTLWGEWLDWIKVWPERLQRSTFPVREMFCICVPPKLPFMGETLIIIFQIPFFPCQLPVAIWVAGSTASLIMHVLCHEALVSEQQAFLQLQSVVSSSNS